MTDAPEGSSLGPRGREDHLASWQERALERATQRFEQGWSVEAVEDDVIPHEGRRDDPSKHFKAMRKQVLAELPHMVGDVLQGRDHAQAPKSLGEALRKACDIEQVTSYRRSRLGITAEEEVALRMAELRERNSSLGPRSLSSRTGRGELGSILREQQSSSGARSTKLGRALEGSDSVRQSRPSDRAWQAPPWEPEGWDDPSVEM